jgi:hypothetical protein
MNPASKDIADILAGAGLGLTVGINIFIGQEPASPASCTTVYDTPGYAPMLTMDGNGHYDYPAIQVRVRNISYVNGYSLIGAIKDELHGLAHQWQGGVIYELVKCDQDPFLLDYDDAGRPRFVCNFSIQRKPL